MTRRCTLQILTPLKLWVLGIAGSLQGIFSLSMDNYRTCHFHWVSLQFLHLFSIDMQVYPACRDPSISIPRSFHGVKICSICSNISSVVEFQRWWVLKSKLFGQESTWHQGKIFKKILRVMTVCQKVSKSYFQSQFWMSKINFESTILALFDKLSLLIGFF